MRKEKVFFFQLKNNQNLFALNYPNEKRTGIMFFNFFVCFVFRKEILKWDSVLVADYRIFFSLNLFNRCFRTLLTFGDETKLVFWFSRTLCIHLTLNDKMLFYLQKFEKPNNVIHFTVIKIVFFIFKFLLCLLIWMFILQVKPFLFCFFC